jgi:structural maintenance of chromosome 1
VQDELKTLRKKAGEYEKQSSTTGRELEKLEREAANLREVIEGEEDEIFADFCGKIGVDEIREYEEKQLRGAQEDNAQMLKFDTQVARLTNQCVLPHLPSPLLCF